MLLTNRLSFLSNSKYVLNLLKSKAPANGSPPQFSLESIQPMPQMLWMPRFECIKSLLALNVEIPPMAEEVRRTVLNHWIGQSPEKVDEATLREQIKQIGLALNAAACHRAENGALEPDKTDLELFEQAVANYHQYKFFNQCDFRMARWGTLEDIQTVDAATFEQPTTCIEFTTLLTPPLAAVQSLADLFPSVRFELRYRFDKSEWTHVEIFPTRPWGY
jgi:hypothetical protein